MQQNTEQEKAIREFPRSKEYPDSKPYPEILKEIKSRGYWKINFYPLGAKETRIREIANLQKFVEKHAVSLRGWPYPFYREEDRKIGQDYIEVSVDFGKSGLFPHHKESWRFYQSGQFIHYRALWEDWYSSPIFFNETQEIPKPGAIISIYGVIYLATEILEFIRRIAAEGIYNEGIRFHLSLVNTENRKLAITDPNRTGFYQDYRSSMSEIDFEDSFGKDQIMSSSKEIALEVARQIFARFGWFMPSIKPLQADQENFLQRRI